MKKGYVNPLPPAGDPRFARAAYELARRSYAAVTLAVQDLDITKTPGHRAALAVQDQARAKLSDSGLVASLTSDQLDTLRFIANQ